MRVSEAVGRALVGLGVDTLFGVIGSGNFYVAKAMAGAGASFIAARHECAALSMADGYARASGMLGVATVHQGPGLTNAVTGLTEAAKARTPLLLLAAETPSAAVHSNFRIDQSALAAAVGSEPERIHSAETALADLARAYQMAVAGYRAVTLMLPLDVQSAEVSGDVRAARPPDLKHPTPTPQEVAAVADLIATAKRPAVLAGRGAVRAGARKALEDLGDRLGAVLATSAYGHGLFAGNPYAVGIAGGFTPPVGVELLRDADLVLVFGASLNAWTTRHGSLISHDARLVQVDIEPTAIGTHREVDLGMIADAHWAARALVDELEQRGHHAAGWRDDDLAGRIARGRWRDLPYEDQSSAEVIDPRTLTIALDWLLPADRTVAIDSGHFMGWPAMYLEVPDPGGFVFNQSFQSVGLGLGAAIGAAVARPDRITVAAVGDGGAFMALGELETAARLRLPLLVVVYNDSAYGAEVHHFRPRGEPVDLVLFPDADLAAIGRACGCLGATVRAPDDLRAVSEWVKAPEGPFVVDAKINPEVVGPWLEEAFRLH